ncbi:MAG: hypothetical protein CM15mP39_07280 [Synechococcus sp.]|nr:MAG: hypothetical protein CM15mP39_07280 [Synechococcus sp.]
MRPSLGRFPERFCSVLVCPGGGGLTQFLQSPVAATGFLAVSGVPEKCCLHGMQGQEFESPWLHSSKNRSLTGFFVSGFCHSSPRALRGGLFPAPWDFVAVVSFRPRGLGRFAVGAFVLPSLGAHHASSLLDLGGVLACLEKSPRATEPERGLRPLRQHSGTSLRELEGLTGVPQKQLFTNAT